MSSVSTSSVNSAGVIRIPNYELLPTSFLKGLEDAALATSVATNVSGDLFNMSRADILPLTEVAEDAVILIPLFTTENSVVMNSTILAEGPMVYIRLDGPPQPRAIFGTCVAYSEDADIREVAVGAKVQFPPPPRLLVGKPLSWTFSMRTSARRWTILGRGHLDQLNGYALACWRTWES